MATIKDIVVSTKEHLCNLIDYTERDNKTAEKELVSCVGCNVDTVYSDFEATRKLMNKPGGILAHQFIHSFAKGEVSAERAHEISCELAAKCFPGYQYIVCTHVDKEHIHSHITVNSVHSFQPRKYAGNLKSLAIVRKASNDLCRQYGLSVIDEPRGTRSLDKTTYECAIKGKSWKLKLVNDLNGILPGAKGMGKEKFLQALADQGYIGVWSGKYLTIVTVDGKKIRLNTLAKQFGWKFSQDYIEDLLTGTKDERELTNEYATGGILRNVVAEDKYSEWAKQEAYYFQNSSEPSYFKLTPEQRKIYIQARRIKGKIKRSTSLKLMIPRQVALATLLKDKDVKKVLDYEETHITSMGSNFGNISYARLKNVYGETSTVELTLEQAQKMKELNIFYSGTVRNGKILVSFKTANAKKVEAALGIDVLSRKTSYEITEEKFIREKFKRIAAQTNQTIYYKKFTAAELRKLESAGICFSYNRCRDIYVTGFFASDLQKVCNTLGLEYATIGAELDQRHNMIAYKQLKRSAILNNTKLEYRIIDAEQLSRLKETDANIAFFPKDNGKYNVAFLASEKQRIAELCYQQGQDREIKHRH